MKKMKMKNKYNKLRLVKIISHIVYGIIWFLFVSFVLNNVLNVGELTNYDTTNLVGNALTSIFGWVSIIAFWIKLYYSTKKFLKQVDKIEIEELRKELVEELKVKLVAELKETNLDFLFSPQKPVGYKCALNPFC